MQKLALVLFASAAQAQVQPGEAIQSLFNNVAPLEGLAIVTRAGACTPITGLAALSIQNVNAVALDPIDDSIWLGSISVAPTTHGVRTLSIDATNAVVAGSLRLRATLPSAPLSSLTGIAFDLDGHAIVTSGAVPPGPGGVFRIDRNSGTITDLLAAHPPVATGIASCVDVDETTGDIYFGVSSGPGPMGGRIYKLTGAPTYHVPPILVGSPAPPSSNATISGIAYRPARGADPDRVYWTTFAGANDAVGFIPAAGGTAVVMPGTPTTWPAMNWIEWDARNDDFLTCTAGMGPDSVMSLSPPGSNALICQLNGNGVAGTPSALDVNDARPGSLRICPQFLPAVPVPTLVELSLHWRAGDFGAIALETSPGAFVLLGVGRISRGGSYVLCFRVTLGAGAPQSLRFWSASIAPDLSAIRGINGPVLWPAN